MDAKLHTLLTYWTQIAPAARRRFPPWLAGIVLGLVVVLFVLPGTGVDVLVTYGPAGRGMYDPGVNPRNPRPAFWLFWLVGLLPWKYDYLLLMLVSIPVLAAAVWLGKGSYWKAFLSFPLVWLLAYGQIDAFVVFGLALAWYALEKEQYILMGLGLAITCILKPQIGLFPTLLFWLWARNKWQPLVIPAVLFALSLVQWGLGWPWEWIQGTLNQVGRLESDWANGSLAAWVGGWAWLAWLPALLVPMDRFHRMRSVFAAMALSLPYFPAYELLIFLVFPVSILEWALTAVPFFNLYGLAWIMPLVVLMASVWSSNFKNHL